MRKQDYLLQLISSLSSNEKRYFKLFCGIQPGDKRYLRLFDAMENMQVYNAEALSSELNLDSRQLKSDKYYLSTVLQRSLRNFEEESEGTGLYKDFLNAALLFKKNLPEFALDMIDNTIPKAEYLEAHDLLLSVLKLKQDCLLRLGRFEELDPIITAMRKWSDALIEFTELSNLCGKFQKIETGRKHATELEKLLRHPLMKKKPENLLSVRAATCWFHNMHRYYAFKEDYKKLLLLARKVAAYYEEHLQIIDISPKTYYYAYVGLLQGEVLSKNYPETEKALEKLESLLIKPSKKLTSSEIEEIRFYEKDTKAYFLRITGRHQEAIKVAEELFAAKDARTAYERYGFIFGLAISLIHLGRSKEAFDKLNELLQMNEDVRSDFQKYVRPLLIVSQLDLGNFTLVPYLIKSTKAWMKREKISNPEIELFFSLTYSIANANESKRPKAWLNLKEALEQDKLKAMNEEINLTNWLAKRLKRH
ncbi:MAG: hypothetical protein JWO06_3348 [Bacteroidota bacterium]|nr:hypothetical protein [Bacteroidota bacterium]